MVFIVHVPLAGFAINRTWFPEIFTDIATGIVPSVFVVTSAKFVSFEIGSQIAIISLVLNDTPSLIEINHFAELPSRSEKLSTGVAATIPVDIFDVIYALSPVVANVTVLTIADDPDKYEDVADDPPPPFNA